jgi:ATP-dependent Lon protease
VTFAPDAVPAITRGYTREAGVRELERRLARVARKLAREAVADPANPPAMQHVAAADLERLLGVPPFDEADEKREDRVGVATGLAYTSIGGDLLEIEVAVVRGRGRLQLTGTLGDVLKESAGAALTYARSRASVLGIDPEFPRTRDLHVHIPDGATPKDGPSAGIGIAVAVVSALTGVAVRGDTAMTGEITLRGRVLPIGGLKEKLVAARRGGVTHVIIPEGNARELTEIPDDIKSGLIFHPVSNMDEVLHFALRGDRPAASMVQGASAAAIGAAVPPPHTH